MTMDRNLALELVRTTEAAALCSARLMGRGDETAADQAAVDAMRNALNRIEMEATVVIGEGELTVPRLLEDYHMSKLREAVEKALSMRTHSRDAIAQFLIPRFSWEQTTFILAKRQHLRLVKVATPDITAYRTLLCEGGAS